MTKRVIKRNGKTVDFDLERIINAISKAMKEINHVSISTAYTVANEIQESVEELTSIEEIEEMVYFKLIENDFGDVAKAYERYRAIHEYQRMIGSIEGIVDGTNLDVLSENSNKDGVIASTQRDLIAGEVSRYYTMNKRGVLTPKVKHAIIENWIKFHDADYHIQKIHNCCLINLEDMLDNGTVINKRKIDSPTNFLTACTVATQIIAAVTSGQYGGATISIGHLAKYLRRSYERALNRFGEIQYNVEISKRIQQNVEIAKRIQQQELEAGIQTIVYQLSTLQCTNGQSPFITIFLNMDETSEYAEELEMIIREMLNQRIKGIKDETGVYVTPAFPKLVYTLDENNVYPGSRYYELTKLAAKCTAARMVPDYVSAKIMREEHEGNIFPPMGQTAHIKPCELLA